jgi:hypothetical protein
LGAERDWLQMIYRVELLLYRDGGHDNPKIFVLLDEGEDEVPAILPDGGCTWAEPLHGRFPTTSTCRSYHVMINADRVIRPPRAVNSP